MLNERVLKAATGGVALRLRLGFGAAPVGLSEEGMLGLAACLRARVRLGCGLIPRHQQGLRGRTCGRGNVQQHTGTGWGCLAAPSLEAHR